MHYKWIEIIGIEVLFQSACMKIPGLGCSLKEFFLKRALNYNVTQTCIIYVISLLSISIFFAELSFLLMRIEIKYTY